jgi:hypothetical protein
VHRGVLAHREVVEDQHEWFGVFADALTPGAIGVAAGEIGEHPGGLREADVATAAGHGVPKCLCHMGFPDPDSEGDRLQQLRAVLPCEVRVVAETHPLFGRLLAAKSFKRWNGVLLLVIDLPDGSPGTIRCDATDVLGLVESGPRSVLDGAGLRALHQLVGQLATRAEVGVSGVGAQVGSPRP